MHPFQLKHAPLFNVYALHVFLVIALGAALANRLEEAQLAMGLGLAMSQCLLLAAWLTLPTTSAGKRLPYALAGGSFWLVLGSFGYSPLFGDDARLAAGGLLMLVTLMSVVLLAARVYLGWRIETSLPALSETYRPRQFHLRHLLITTALFATVFALLRLVLPLASGGESAFNPLAWAGFLLAMLIATLPAIAVVGTLANRQNKRFWSLSFALLLGLVYVGVLVVELSAMIVLQPSSLDSGIVFLTRFELNLCLSVWATLFIWQLGTKTTLPQGAPTSTELGETTSPAIPSESPQP